MKITALLLFFLAWSFSIAQNFVEVPDLDIPGVNLGWVDFADIDGDGDQDLMIQGRGEFGSLHTKLYENDGYGNFSEIADTPFLTFYLGCFDFADVDGDCDLDLLISGRINDDINGQRSTKLYLNDGTGKFTESTNNTFINVSHGEIAFADIDGDSDEDVLITGYNRTLPYYAKLYENDGSGKFSERTSTPFVGVARGSIAFADVDGDLDQDVLITGDADGNTAMTRLYLNDGSGEFIAQNNSSFINVTSGSVAFADIDGDTDQDVLISGGSSVFLQGEGTVLYTNDGSGNFTLKEDSPFEGVRYSHVAFADIDGDLDQDVLITGDGELTFSGLYLNDGMGNFLLSTDDQIYPVEFSCVAFADVDNDNDLDLFLTGFNATPDFPDWYNAKLYLNENQLMPNPVTQKDPLPDFILYPNPVKSRGQINLGYDYNLSGPVEYRVFDSSGRIILHGKSALEQGNDNIPIDIIPFVSGVYYLRILHCQIEKVFRFVVVDY